MKRPPPDSLPPQRVVVGTQFRSPIADGLALWEVDRVDDDIARCHVVNERWQIPGTDTWCDSDHAGLERPFNVTEIRRTLELDARLRSLLADRKGWWAGVQPGTILHYHDAFGRYLRGVVVDVDGTHEFKPTAMVGLWSQGDVVRVDQYGEAVYGYHAKKILEGSSWQPDAACMFEHPQFTPRKPGNPATFAAWSLTVPEPTADEAQGYADERKCREIWSLLSERPDSVTRSVHKLREAKRLLDEHLDGRTGGTVTRNFPIQLPEETS